MKQKIVFLFVSILFSTLSFAQLIISEFRLRGPNGANDEFIEIYNNSNSNHTVAGGGTGYAIVASNGVARGVIPNGTVIPPRGHYLFVNSVGYSLASYPAGNGTTATGDATYTTDIPDNAGIALFNTSVSGDFTLANRLDAVGSTSEANTLYKEGTGYPALVPFSIDYCFHRRQMSGLPVDNNNNAADFKFEDTNGTSAGAGQSLGAPGPENLSSPVIGAGLVVVPLDNAVAGGVAPNVVRDFTSDPPNNSTFGTIDFRLKITNNSGGNVTRIRFRIVDVSTFPSPSGIADLRPRTSTAVVVTTSTGNVTVQGTTLEQPPSQPNGGGINSSMSVGVINLGSPLPNGASENIRILCGIQQTGSLKLDLLLEALPTGAGSGAAGSGLGASTPFFYRGETNGAVFFNSNGVQAGDLIISEFRVRGPNGANDEFIEIYNKSGIDHTVAGVGTGYAIVASDGVTRGVIPNGTVIPAKGHYLFVNSVGYSLASYPAGNGTTATGDATYTTGIPDNAGIALFNTSISANFTLANRLDAVGSTSEANTLYKEGAGYPALTPFSIDYCWKRETYNGTPVDTDDNAADLEFDDTNGTSAGGGQRLGAPGPENLSSPVARNAGLVVSLLDPCVSEFSPPNRVRDFTSDPPNNSTFGTWDVRYTITNNTGVDITRLRFRIDSISTFPMPSGFADLRPRTSTAVVVTVDRAPCGSGTSNITVQGTTLEQPPSQPNGGGYNSSMSAGVITLGTPLANGATVDIRLLFGIQQDGAFKVKFTPEVLPVTAATGATPEPVLISSVLPCNISSVTLSNQGPCNNNCTPNDNTDDYFTTDITVNFTNPPATGTLRIEPGNPNVLDVVEIPVGSLVGNSHTFTGVRLRSTGATYAIELEFSADNACVRTVSAPAVSSCSTPCSISSASFSNVSSCNNNGTPGDPSDDYYTANLTVNFANPPCTGTLRIEPGNPNVLDPVSIPVGSLVGNSHTFTGVRLRANGSTFAVEIEFSDLATACVRTIIAPAVNNAPVVDPVSNQTYCAGATVPATAFTSSTPGVTFSWSRTVPVPDIGLGTTAGTGNVPSFTATNTSNAPITATFSVVASNGSCTGAPIQFTITINPTPSVNPVSNVTVCNGATTSPINFSGPVSGTMFNWTNSNPAIGLPASGTGNIAPFTAINPGVGPVSATITVTPVTNTAQATINFNYTGAVQTWTVPAGVTSINVQAFGAQGNSNALGVAGGLGGSATGTLAVTPGSTLYINVGGGGIVSATGGFNGGGNAGSSACASAIGGGGGGASDIRDGANTLGARVLVAAGGAGAGGNRVSGCGRGTGGGGGAGYYGGGGGAAWPNTSTVLPTGGTQAAGGTGGDSNWGSVPGNDGSPGGLGTGGNGGVEISSSQTANATALSGGGAGGGLTGANGIYGPNWTGQSGAGGSSYIGGVTSGSTISGVQAGNGSVIISYIAPVTPVICTGTPISFTITVNPTPTITCPANVVANSTPGQCGAIVTYPAATATGVPAPTITYSHPSGSFFPVGVTTVTATATNSCGTVSCTFTVTVNDVQPPVITCPANITVGNDPGLCSAVVNYALPSASDNCNKLQVPQTILPHGGGAITFAGNNAPGGYYFNITNNSATPKTISSLSVRFGSTSVGGAVPSPAPVSVYVTTSATTYVGNQTNAGAWTAIGTGIPVTVAGPNSEFSLVPLPGGGFTLAPGQSKGMYVLGTVSSLLYNSAANSNTTPISNGVLTVTPGQASSGLFTAGASPRIPNIIINYITLTQTAGLPSGSVFPVGTTTNTYTATDDAGNTSSCSFTVRVNDVQAPTITCPGNITVTSPAGSCTAVVTYAATANDNCPGVTVQVVSGPASGSAFPVGTTTVTLRAVDAAGNVSANCSFTVTVLDGQLPVITAQPQNRTVCAGQSATFSVTAITSPNANGPLSYQWQSWNGAAWVDISGATASSYTVSNTTVSQNTNSYRVRVIGLCTTITSTHATLYVNPNPTVTLTTNIPPAILPTQSVTITAVPSIAGGTYQWYKNGVLIAGATSQTLGPLTVADIGSYRVVYTAPTGCVGTSADLAVTGLATPNLYVYPNPNRGQFTIQFYNQANEEVTVRVFDSKGAQVYQRKVLTTIPYTNIQIDLTNGRILTSGVYIVDVLDSGGRQIGTRRIIVYQ